MVASPSLCLDTDICIDVLRGARSLGDLARADVPTQAMWISAITLAELGYGVARSRWPERERAELTALLGSVGVREFGSRAAEVAGAVRARLAAMGAGIGALDSLIGAHALAEGAVLMTRNIREFSRIPGLAIAEA
mgnify:FL=1